MLFECRYKGLINIISFGLIVLFAGIMFIVTFWTIDKGFTFDDEAWYLFLLKDNPSYNGSSQFYKYFFGLFSQGSIFKIRLSVFIADLVAVLVFSIGLFKYFSVKGLFKRNSFTRLILIFCFTYLGLHLSAIPVSMVFSYITMNRQIMLLTFGVLFISLASKKKANQSFLPVIGGFLSGNLFFIMITNTPILLFIMVYLGLVEKNIRILKFYFLGVVFGIAFYFIFIENPINYFENFHTQAVNTIKADTQSRRGLLPMAWWLFSTFLFFVKFVFYPVLSLFGLKYLKTTKYDLLFAAFLLSFSFVTFLYIKNFVFEDGNGWLISSFAPILVISTYFMLNLFLERNIDFHLLSIFILLVFLTPLFLSLGTDVPFIVRGASYVTFMLPITYVVSQYYRKNQFYHLVLVLLIIIYMMNFITLPKRTNWAHIIYTEQNILLSDVGINQKIKLDENRVQGIKSLRDELSKGDIVVLSDRSLWGYAYLLELLPAHYNFRFNSSQIETLPPETIFLEDKQKPFDARTITWLQSKSYTKIPINKGFVVYRKVNKE